MNAGTQEAETAGRLRALSARLADDPEFQSIAESLSSGHGGVLGGVWGGTRALVLASLAQRVPGVPVAVVPHDDEAERLAESVELFGDRPAAVFPSWPGDADEVSIRDRVFGQRLSLLAALRHEKEPPIVVASASAILQGVPSPDVLEAATLRVAVGETLDPDALAKRLQASGLHGTSGVEMPGEFAIRGGIVDLFPPDRDRPIRIELFGDEVESIRSFDVATQRSLGTLDQVATICLGPDPAHRAHVTAHLPPGAWFLVAEPADVQEAGETFVRRLDRPERVHSVKTTLAEIARFPSAEASSVPVGSYEATCHVGFESVERFSGDPRRLSDEIDEVAADHDVWLVCPTSADAERMGELLAGSRPAESGRLRTVVGRLAEGFRYPKHGVLVLSANELLHRSEVHRGRNTRQLGRAIDSFLDLREGDLVVHLAHGIGRYRGIKLLEKEGRADEHLQIEYHGGAKIFVPASKIDLVQKYVGGKKATPPLARVGGKSWANQKKAAQRAVTDLAAEMLEVQARRSSAGGIAYPQDSDWQREFDASFPYQETPDQLAAISDVKSDMRRPIPMDRLLCGDVGFGKTEVAMRAAFKAVDAGYQVAVLVPTTVLAEQHRRTFAQRMAEFPITVASLSRLATKKQQNELLKSAGSGGIDILIGTHRLASPDVRFENLGLVVIDEEQRFGVAVKERLKALRSTVDVLTMTATPIPRTLHMSLLGVRSISNLETPPPDRLAVETRVTRFDEDLIRHAVLRELNRKGQVYFLHNRVADIQAMAAKLGRIVPEARVAVGHGQMADGELERVMLGFVSGDYDVLLATTIIESGLDIPSANTIFIDDADRHGLADLHQLRGRVGRSEKRAYCYLMVNENKRLTPEASRRLRAIEEFSQMGAGFAIALRDLELRGAGNLLGTQQSGHIATVGYELYCSMLEKAVRRMKRMPPKEHVDVSIDLPLSAYLPDGYVPDVREKITLYRRLGRIVDGSETGSLAAELRDRFGPLPPPVERLLATTRVRAWAHAWGVTNIRQEDKYLVFGYSSRHKLNELVARSGRRLRVADAISAYLPLASKTASGDALLAACEALLRPVGEAA